MRNYSTWWIIIGLCSLLECSLAAEESHLFGSQVEMHGFISQGYLQSDRNNFYANTADGTWQFNEVGLNVGVDLSDRLSAGMQFLSRDLGDIGNNTVEVDWAFADYRLKDWFGLRAGILKIPWGIYNETRDIDMLRTFVFLPASLYAEEERDVYASLQGISVYSHHALKWLGDFSYQALYGDKEIAQASAMLRYNPLVLRGGYFEDFQITNVTISYLEWETPLQGVRLRNTSGQYETRIRAATPLPSSDGSQEYAFFDETGSERFTILSAEYARERFALAAEGLWVWRKEKIEQADGENVEEDAAQSGWYASLSYRATDRWEFGTYYAAYYNDADDKDGQRFEAKGEPAYLAWQKDVALTARCDVNAHWTVKLEGHWVNGAARIRYFNFPNLPQENSFLLAVKTTVNF